MVKFCLSDLAPTYALLCREVRVARAACRVSPRRATHLSFASPKESKQRKGDPTVCVPTLRFGQPALLTKRGRYANSAAPQTRVSLIPVLLRCSAHTEGEVRIAKSNS